MINTPWNLRRTKMFIMYHLMDPLRNQNPMNPFHLFQEDEYQSQYWAADEEFGEEDHPIYEEGDTFQEVSEIIHKEPDHCQEEEEEACQEEEAEARQEEEAEARQEKGADPYNYDYPLKEGRQLHETDEDKDDDGENTDADLH